MADTRISMSVRLSDATTPSQQLTVDSGGNAYVKVNAALPTGANVIGAITQSGTWTVATNADATPGGGAAPSKALLAGVEYLSSLPTLTTGQASAAMCDTSGRILVGSIASALPAGSNVIGQVTQSGTWTVGQGTAAAVGGAWPVIVTDLTNTMPSMDVAARKGFVAVTDGTNILGTSAHPLTTTADTPTVPVVSYNTSASLAAGASATLVWSGTGATYASTYLWQLDVAASVPVKAVIQSLSNGSATTVTVLFTVAGGSHSWTPPKRQWVQAGSSGTNGFQAVVTNLDESLAADVYATIYSATN